MSAELETAPQAEMISIEVECVLWTVEAGTSPVEACATFEMEMPKFLNHVMADVAMAARYIHAVHAQYAETQRAANDLGAHLGTAMQWESPYRQITREMSMPYSTAFH